MSRNKRDSGALSIYGQHFSGFANNPAMNREAVIENMYRRILTELAINRFKWTGFPDSIDIRFLEKTLFFNALCVFYYDNTYNKFLALRGGGTNWVNMVDNPVGFTVVGNQFVGKHLSAIRDTDNGGKAIPIWANTLRTPDLDIVMTFANTLANIGRTVEINSQNARRSKMIVSNENQRLSVININRQVDEGHNAISVTGPMQDMPFIQALDLGVEPKTIESMHIVKTRVWNECMGLLGIENANQDKTERLVSSEVDANNDQTSMMRWVNLNERKRAAERINKHYGLNVNVEYYTDEERQSLMDVDIIDSEGDE